MTDTEEPSASANRPSGICNSGAEKLSGRRYVPPSSWFKCCEVWIDFAKSGKLPIIPPIKRLAIMPEARATPALRPPATRSRAANRPNAITGADGRSAGARLLRDSERELALEFFNAEPSGLSPSQRLAISAVAALRVRLEGMRSAVARGDAIDDEVMTRLSNAIGRELSRLERLAASQRKAKATGGPDALKAYLADKAAREAAA